jgi:hypothetical protein
MPETTAGNVAIAESKIMLTSIARRSRTASRRLHVASAWNRLARLRASMLAALWMVPGIWCAAHTLSHLIEPEHHDSHVALPASAGILAISCNHDHGHFHPEALPVLSMEGTKKIDSPRLLTGVVEIECPKATLHSHEGAPSRLAARRAAAVSGPRAPPIS